MGTCSFHRNPVHTRSQRGPWADWRRGGPPHDPRRSNSLGPSPIATTTPRPFLPGPNSPRIYSQTVSLSEDLDSYLFGQDQRESRGDKEMAARQISAHRSEPRLRDSTMHLPNEVVVTMHPPLVAHGELLLALCL
jgi:hypothetical protein